MGDKVLIFPCDGGNEAGVAVSKACIRIWEENPDDIKIGCLSALIVPWKFNEVMKDTGKSILIDACDVQCGRKLFEREGIIVDRYIEVSSSLGHNKEKKLNSEQLEKEIYGIIHKEMEILLGKNLFQDKKIQEDFSIAFGTDDGKNLNDDHVGMAKYFYVYRFFDNKKEFIERRENVQFKGDESIKHGDPEKARATSSVLEGIDVVVGRKFGPNIIRLLKEFVCVVAREDSISNAIEAAYSSREKILEQKHKGRDRKHIVL
jgi:uncharacterized metal-binding protein/predicted Fe-Mo cluster-binding NifX family protein